jgi:TolC family type I secretion outer membrane protein
VGQRFPRAIGAWSALIGQALVVAPVLADAQPGFTLMPLIGAHEPGKIFVSQTHSSKTDVSKITALNITGPNIIRLTILGPNDVGPMPEVSPTMVFRIPHPVPASILDGPPLAVISARPALVVQHAELPALIATAEPVSRVQTIAAVTYGPPADLADSPYAVSAGQNSALPDEAMSFEQEANSAPDERQEPSTPPGDTESLTSAIIAALKANPEIQIALAVQDDSRYGVHEAWAGYMPHLDLTLGYGREFVKQAGRAGTYQMRTEGSITLNQNLWDFGVTLNDIRRARATFRSAQWATRERIEAIAYDISSAYLVILQQQKLYELTTAEMDATRKILKVVTIQKELGLTTSADVGRVQARLESLQSVLLDRRSTLGQAKSTYRRLTGHEPGIAVDLPDSSAAVPATISEAVAEIDTRSPRMAQAVQDRLSLKRQADSQTGNFFPRIGLQIQGNRREDVLGPTGLAQDARAMVTLSYRFFNGGQDLAIRRRIDARLRQADFELERRKREVEQDLRIDFDALRAAREKIATIDAETASSQKVADLYRQQFRESRRTVFELLDSQQVLFAAKGNKIVNDTALRAAEFRVLQRLAGLFELLSGGQKLPDVRGDAKSAFGGAMEGVGEGDIKSASASTGTD